MVMNVQGDSMQIEGGKPEGCKWWVERFRGEWKIETASNQIVGMNLRRFQQILAAEEASLFA